MSDIFKKILKLLAALSLVMGLILKYFVVLEITRLPDNFSYTAQVASQDDFYDSEKDTYRGPQYTVTKLIYEVVSKEALGLEIKNSFNVETLDGEEVFSTSRLYGIDPVNGKHISSMGDEAREGYLFAPRGLQEGESYTYWHVNYNVPAVMSFVGKEMLNGLTVYHYESYFESTPVDQTKELDYLPEVGESKGIKVEPHLEIWIEPVTGYLVNYEDEATAYYYDLETGEDLEPWNHFQNSFTDESIETHVELAKDMKLKVQLFDFYLPLSCLILSGLCWITVLWRSPKDQAKGTRVPFGVTLFMILAPLSLTLIGWALIRHSIYEQIRLQFEKNTQLVEDAILKNMEIYVTTLRGTTGLFEASQDVSASEWSAYINQLDLSENYPGIAAVGFVQVVSESEVDAFESDMQSQGFSSYDLYPEGERGTYAPVKYIEFAVKPAEPSQMLGYDMYYETMRDQAIVQARDSGETSISGLVELITSEADKRGFLIYIPVYRKDMPTDTLEERRAAIYGFTYTPFTMSDMMGGIFGNTDLPVTLELYNGTSVSAKELLYDSSEHDPTPESSDAQFTSTDTFYIAGHPWTFHFVSQEELRLTQAQKMMLYGSLICGLIVSFLITLIYYSVYISRQRILMGYFGKSGRKRKIL